MRSRVVLAGLWLAVCARTAWAAPPTDVVAATCATIEAAAGRHHLPIGFFTRLIWQESRFDAKALSPVGAQGVAQFMPRTAAGRGLVDPFSPPEAIEQAASYLDELRQQFGNFGLAAAGYNAGPGRLSQVLAGQQAELPGETLAYVEIVTGHSVDEWRAPKVPDIEADKPFSCQRFVALAGPPATTSGAAPARGKDWAVILVGNPRRDKVMEQYAVVRGQFSKILGGLEPSVVHKRVGGLEVARYIVQIEQDSRSGANDICSRLQRAGGNCFVLSNRIGGRLGR